MCVFFEQVSGDGGGANMTAIVAVLVYPGPVHVHVLVLYLIPCSGSSINSRVRGILSRVCFVRLVSLNGSYVPDGTIASCGLYYS